MISYAFSPVPKGLLSEKDSLYAIHYSEYHYHTSYW